MPETPEAQVDHLLGRLKQLQVRYPGLVRDVRPAPLAMDIEFFLPDLAIDATHSLLEAGITAVHRLDRPQLVSVQIPSLLAQEQIPLVVHTLDAFLQRHSSWNPERHAPVMSV